MRLVLLLVLLIVLFAVVWGWVCWLNRKPSPAPVEGQQSRKEQIELLTSLPKEDYDFLVANGLEAPPEVARFFYGSDTPANLAAEQRKAIAGQEAWLALRRGYRKGERQEEVSKGRQMADWINETYGFDPVMLRQIEKQKAPFKSWIDTEKIRG